MICLGIESTAHTFGVGMCNERTILANEKHVFTPSEGGIHPREASRHHTENAGRVLEDALKVSNVSLRDVNVFSFAQGPGIGPCLRTGAVMARFFSLQYNKPLLGVNHCIAHIEIGLKETGATDPVVLYVSGGNTQVITYEAGRYRVIGESLDIGVGNALDKFARDIGLMHPGGPKIEELAKKGNYLELPYSVKGMDLSFTGIVTNLVSKVGKHSLGDLCYSFQETVFAMLTEVTERALAHTNKKEVLLCGGVGANRRLQEMLETMCKDRGASFYVPEQQYLGDQGAMIAWLGLIMHKNGCEQGIDESVVKQKFRTDEVEVTWR